MQRTCFLEREILAPKLKNWPLDVVGANKRSRRIEICTISPTTLNQW